MDIQETEIDGVYLINRSPFIDERGYFVRTFCRRELEAAGLCGELAQVNLSQNNKLGTLRGLHQQADGAAEDKLVSCTRGEIYDVCVDLRGGSPTFGKYIGAFLSEENGKMLYVPKGCAHGYLTLREDSQVLYFVTEFYQPGSEIGYRYNDPFFAIQWPLQVPYILSDKDRSWPFLSERR